MSPSTKSHRELKVSVPRHNSQRIGPVLTENVQKVAIDKGVRVDVSQTAFDPTSALAQAIESASEWNSLLMTARAERGPQWDVGTQLFHVDEFAKLYYDSSSLQQELQQTHSDGPSSSHRQQEAHTTPLTRTNSMPPGGMPPSMSQAQLYGTPQGLSSPRHFPGSSPGMPYGMSGIPPAQFYGTGDGMSASALQRPPGPPMGMPPMGMAQGMGMSMAGIPDGAMSPEVRRRVTRGMTMDEFSMHG